MTTPKTAEEIARSIVTEIAREMTRDIDLEDSVRTAWTALDAYLLQESAPLVGALNYINHLANQEGEQVGYSIKSQRVAQKALLCFQKKHGGVV